MSIPEPPSLFTFLLMGVAGGFVWYAGGFAWGMAAYFTLLALAAVVREGSSQESER